MALPLRNIFFTPSFIYEGMLLSMFNGRKGHCVQTTGVKLRSDTHNREPTLTIRVVGLNFADLFLHNSNIFQNYIF